MHVIPYVVGQSVRSEKFYGRGKLIRDILHGNESAVWLVGTRRIGKTSALKQLEHLAKRSPDLGYLPIFWDLSTVIGLPDFPMSFSDSLQEAEDLLARWDIPLDAVIDNGDVFETLGSLRRRLRSRGGKLLLLCDEAEQLMKLREQDPTLLTKLRRSTIATDDVRCVLASTIRLWSLTQEHSDGPAFLEEFTPPRYIQNLTDAEARALIRQENLPEESRPRIDKKAVECIRQYCDNHPYLMQLLARRYQEVHYDLERAVGEIAADPMVSFFFAEDFKMLSPTEQDILKVIGDQDSSTSNSIQQHISVESNSLNVSLHRLEHLGYVRRNEEGRFVLVNHFFSRWFRELPSDGKLGAIADKSGQTTRVDSQTMTASDAVALGPFDTRYELLERIDRGAMGVVYKACDNRLLGTDIAIKILRQEYAAHEEAVERLRREVVLGRDIAHPNVVSIYHLGECESRTYLTMQWINGPTLSKLIKEQAPFSILRVVYLSKKLAGALEAAHARKVLHRDIKPGNILMDQTGEPHLSDFGIARLMDSASNTTPGLFIGTPDYASPEQIRTQSELDERSDLYSLGVVVFEMATGRKPFLGATTQKVLDLHLKAAPPVPHDLRAEIPVELSRLILRCLEKQPADRFQSARELRLAFEALERL